MYLALLIASVGVFLTALLIYLRQPFANLMHPATYYLAFHGFVFVVRPLFAYYYDFSAVYHAYQFYPSLFDKMTVIAGANLAFITFMFVSFRIANQTVLADPGDDHSTMRQKLLVPILISVAVFLPLGSWSQIQNWIRVSNGRDDMDFDPETGFTVNSTAIGWFTDAALTLAPVAIMLVWLGRYRPWTWVVFGLYAFSQAGTGTRGPIIYALAGVSMIYLIERGRRWIDGRVVIAAALGLLTFNVVVQDRGASIRQLFDQRVKSEVGEDEGLAPLEHMDFANMEYFEYLVYVVPQRSGSWDYFAQNLQIFTEPIPRVMWRDKPIGSPVKFYSLWDYGKPIGMTQSLPGAGWVSFGWFGIIIQASFYAWLYSALYRALLVRRYDLLSRMTYVLIAATATLTFRDGQLLTFLRLIPFYLSPWLVAVLFARLSGFGQHQLSVRTLQTVGGHGGPASPAERRRALAQSADGEHSRPRR